MASSNAFVGLPLVSISEDITPKDDAKQYLLMRARRCAEGKLGGLMRPTICFLTIACASIFISILLPGQSISATEAAKHVGERKTVCGTIAGEHTAPSSRGTPTFINLDKAYPNQVFTVLIWGDDRANVGQFPKSGRVCATGAIKEYRGSPEIVLRDAKNWYVPK